MIPGLISRAAIGWYCALALACLITEIQAQEVDTMDTPGLSSGVDAVIHKSGLQAEHIIEDIVFKKRITKPKKATILSAVLPGAGQVYNGQYYKLPVIYGGIGALLSVIDFNSTLYRRADTDYRLRLAGEDPIFYSENIPLTSLENERELARKNRELSYFGLGLVYLFNVADAFVSSHLTEYDIDEDLSRVRIKPKLSSTSILTGLPFPAAGVTLTF